MRSKAGFMLAAALVLAAPERADGACAADPDCGECGACSGGVCTSTGDVACSADKACPSGQTCKVDAADACKNHCLEAGKCDGDADCGGCAVCVGGECKGLGLIACMTDSDCGAGKTCLVDTDAPCKNQCVDALPPIQCTSDTDCDKCAQCLDGACVGAGTFTCATDADCGEGAVCTTLECSSQCDKLLPPCTKAEDCGACAACVDGECKGTGVVACTIDTDCGAGKKCVADAVAPCKNQCVDAGPAGCTKDDECGACAVCVDSECKGTGAVMCEKDADCGAGKTCLIDGKDPCKNMCMDSEPPPLQCTTDANCGQCAACVNGECKGTGAVMCTKDEDCTGGNHCMVDDADPCKNMCMTMSDGDATAKGSDAGSTADVHEHTESGGHSSGCAGAPGPAPVGGLLLMLLVVWGLHRSRNPE